MDSDGSFRSEFKVHVYNVLWVTVLLPEMPARGIGADGEEGQFATPTVDAGYIGVEGGDIACISGVEEERVGGGSRVGTVD